MWWVVMDLSGQEARAIGAEGTVMGWRAREFAQKKLQETRTL